MVQGRHEKGDLQYSVFEQGWDAKYGDSDFTFLLTTLQIFLTDEKSAISDDLNYPLFLFL